MGRMGEFELLARIRERLPADGPRIHLGSGDDAAVTVPGGATATSVDALVDGVHFRRDLASPAQIGHKALATALSDLAAMGAEPGEAYVVLGLPPDLGEDGCIELLDGMIALAAATGTDPRRRRPEPRRRALPRDHSRRPCVRSAGVRRSRRAPSPATRWSLTGEIGGAAAGLELLDDPDREADFALRCLCTRRRSQQRRGAAARTHAAARGRTGARARRGRRR